MDRLWRDIPGEASLILIVVLHNGLGRLNKDVKRSAEIVGVRGFLRTIGRCHALTDQSGLDPEARRRLTPGVKR